MQFFSRKCIALSVKTSQYHVKYEKTLKVQSIQQQYIGIIASTSIDGYTYVNNVTSRLSSVYIKLGK